MEKSPIRNNDNRTTKWSFKEIFFLFFNATRPLIGCCKSMRNNRQRRLSQDEESTYITICWIKPQSSFSMFKWNFESNKSVYRAHLKLRCIRFCLDVRTSCSVLAHSFTQGALKAEVVDWWPLPAWYKQCLTDSSWIVIINLFCRICYAGK